MLKGTEIFLWVNEKYLGYCYPTLAKSWVTLLISCKIGVFIHNTILWERKNAKVCLPGGNGVGEECSRQLFMDHFA